MSANAHALQQFAVGIRNPAAGDHQGYATAFFGQSRGRLGLYTAAHNLANKEFDARPFLAINDCSWVVPAIEVYVDRDPGARRMLGLSQEQEPIETCSKTLVATSPAPRSNCIWDVVRLSSSFVDDLFEAMGGRISVVDIDDWGDSEPGAVLRCVGFPPATQSTDRDTWARASASSYEGSLIRSVEDHLQAAFRPDAGLSGGPVFTEENKFAGVLVGKNIAPDLAAQYQHMLARIVPAAVSASL